jgi:hypothetical protein
MNRPDDIIKKLLDQATGDAYQRGWDDAMKSFEQAAKKAISQIQHIIPISQGGSTSSENFVLVSPDENRPMGRPNSSEGTVFNTIVALPGNTGAFIAGQLPDIHERTVRTSLRRLRIKGLIEKRNGGWFAKISSGDA